MFGERVLHVRSTRNTSPGGCFHFRAGMKRREAARETGQLHVLAAQGCLGHDTAFPVLSATAIYTSLFSVILSPLGDSVFDKYNPAQVY